MVTSEALSQTVIISSQYCSKAVEPCQLTCSTALQIIRDNKMMTHPAFSSCYSFIKSFSQVLIKLWIPLDSCWQIKSTRSVIFFIHQGLVFILIQNKCAVFNLRPSPVQLAVLLLREAALIRSGQRWSTAFGLPAHAGALWDVPRDGHAYWDFCAGNHHTSAPRQRSAQHTPYMFVSWLPTLWNILRHKCKYKK